MWSAATVESSAPDDPNTDPIEQILSIEQHAAWGEVSYFSDYDLSSFQIEWQKFKVQNEKVISWIFRSRINQQFLCSAMTFLSIKQELLERHLAPPNLSRMEVLPKIS